MDRDKKTTVFVIPRKKLEKLRNKKPTKEYMREKEAIERARCKSSELGEYVYNVSLINHKEK